MNRIIFFAAFLLAGLVHSAPTSDDDKIEINEECFPNELAIYTAEHDIVNLLLPLNALNFEDDDDDDLNDSTILFFVEADVNDKGERTDQGLYVLRNHIAKKLLDHGRDAAAANDDTKTAYFAAKDGIYVFNAEKDTAEKYGSVTDSLISIAKVNGSDILYVLTEDHVLYKVTHEGTKKEKINEVHNAQQIVLDYENNLYYYTSEKEVYVLNADGVRKIEGLPANPSYLNIIKPPFIIENGIPVIANKETYIAYVNGTSEKDDFILTVKPTAYALEGTIIEYFAYNKKIYEYNILTILVGTLLEELKTFFEDKSDAIQSIATRSRSDLRA